MSKTDRYLLDPMLVIVPANGDATALGTLLPEATVRGIDAATGQIGSTGQATARMAVAGQNVLVTAGAWAGLDIPIRWHHVVMPKAPYGPAHDSR